MRFEVDENDDDILLGFGFDRPDNGASKHL
jgi:hypothetical protein